MAVKTTYTVNHAFAHDGVFYSKDNEADIAKLPTEVLDDVVSRGLVTKNQTGTAEAPRESETEA